MCGLTCLGLATRLTSRPSVLRRVSPRSTATTILNTRHVTRLPFMPSPVWLHPTIASTHGNAIRVAGIVTEHFVLWGIHGYDSALSLEYLLPMPVVPLHI